jgi:hypothetical protein
MPGPRLGFAPSLRRYERIVGSSVAKLEGVLLAKFILVESIDI